MLANQCTCVGSYSNGGWNVYLHAADLSGDAWVDINRKCPQSPDGIYEDEG